MPYARLDRGTGLKVLCGKVVPIDGRPRYPCNGQLAEIKEVTAMGGTPIRSLVIEPGWSAGEDGVWHQTEAARRSARIVGRSRFRRPVRVGKDDEGGGRLIQPSETPMLPVVAECPLCHHPQVLDPDVLRVNAPRQRQDRQRNLEEELLREFERRQAARVKPEE